MTSINAAVRFHGHLGPYLVLGLLAGEMGLKRTGSNKYFGLEVKVYGANKKPKSCLIDGLQLSTGATYGKGNIQKHGARDIKINFCNLENNKKLTLAINERVESEIDALKGHSDSERFARRLLKIDKKDIFIIL